MQNFMGFFWVKRMVYLETSHQNYIFHLQLQPWEHLWHGSKSDIFVVNVNCGYRLRFIKCFVAIILVAVID